MKSMDADVLKSISKLKSVTVYFNWPCEEHG